jgi:hypothetical protein
MFSHGKTRPPTCNSLLTTGLILISFGLLFFITACGGGGGDIAGTPEPPPVVLTTTQFRIGDATGDSLVSLEAELRAMHLIDNKGNSINILPSTRRIEFTHLAGALEPLQILDIPQGTYTQATFTGGAIHVSYISHVGGVTQLHEFTSDTTEDITVALSPALVIGAQPSVVSIDFDLSNFVTIDPINNTPPVLNDPKFTISVAPVKTSGEQEPENGEMQGLVGIVGAVKGTSFTMSLGQNKVPLTFTTDGNTKFENAALSTLTNMIVKVNGVTQAGGTLLAKEVEALENQNGVQAEGLVFSWNYTNDLWLIPQDGTGAGLMNPPEPPIGREIRADISQATFDVNSDGIDMTGLNFPFDISNIWIGQRVRVEAASGMIRPDPNGTDGLIPSASRVTLEKQTLTGAVVSYSANPGGVASFVLNIPPDSYFEQIRFGGYEAISVWMPTSTHLHGVTTITAGDTLHVRGLLFFTPNTAPPDSWNLVAERIWK